MAKTAPRGVGSEGAGRLLERERESETIERAIEQLGDGGGSLLLLEGPAGIGKTRLLELAAGLARERECLVRTARGGQLEREMPFGVCRQLFESVVERASDDERSRALSGSAELALPALGIKVTGNAEGDSHAPFHGLYWLVANLTQERRLVLVVDDVHWADVQTLRWLDYLGRRLADLPALVVAAIRSGEPDEPAELEPLRLAAEPIKPAPLSARAVEDLIGQEFPNAGSEFADACATVTGGNPFLLAELLRTLSGDGIKPGEEAVESIMALGTQSIARYVLMRLARFGRDAIAVGKAVAVLGSTRQLRLVAALAGVEQSAAMGICDELRGAEILAPGMPLEFVHPLVGSAIYGELGDGERTREHRRAAQLLAEIGAGADRIAPHLTASDPSGDQWVVARLCEAAALAMSANAHDAAARYLTRAMDEPAEDELTVLYSLGVALRGSDPARAPEVMIRVAEETDEPALRKAALLDASRALFDIGNIEQASHWLDLAIEATADREERLPLEALAYGIKSLCSGSGSLSSRRLRESAERVGTRSEAGGLIRIAVAWDRFLACDPVDEVIELARSIPSSPWEIKTVPIMGCKVLAWCGYPGDAREAIGRQLDAAREKGLMLDTSYLYALMAEVDRLGGRLADSETEARIAWETASELASISLPAWSGLINLIASLLARGDITAAAKLSERVPYFAKLSEIPMTPVPIEVRGLLRLAQGELSDGASDLLTHGEDLEQFGVRNPAASPWRQEAATALVALDRVSEAQGLVAEGEKRARLVGAPHVIATMLRARAQLEPRRRGIATLEESAALIERSGAPHELARTLVDLGAALRRAGERVQAREPLRRGMELAVRCGADGLVGRAREELAAAGSRPRSVFRTGVASLTASERRTAMLAAEGLSNVEIAQRLFVSRKTVEKHLGNAYTKLEISGREELEAVLTEL